MSRRIDIELTSSRDDGTWTWRAAGAKQPKGVLSATVLPAGSKVGDVVRAEVDSGLDGTEVLAVLPPKAKKSSSGERIELLGRTVSDDELVTTVLARRGRGDRGDRGDRGGRGDRGERRGRGDGRGGDRRPRSDGERTGGDRAGGDRRGRGPREGGGDRPDRPRRDRPAPPARPKAKRLRPGRTHRRAALDALAPEEQVIAEQLLRGGVPAVRQAVEKQNEAAKAEGRPQVKADALLAVAERLLPALRVAEWRDRAEAAVADLDELDLRDLRSVIVAADSAAKDDETRALADQLRAGLTRRVEAEQQAWLAELAETLGDGRVVRALRLSSRPPKAGAPLPADLATKLAEAASAALTADTLPDRWSTVLDALSFSPVRAQVVPASRPEAPSEELVTVITTFASRLPRVAEAFGITPPPDAGRRKGRGGKGRAGAKPIPPAPPQKVEATPPAEDGATGAPTEADQPVPPAANAEAPEAAVGEPEAPADDAPEDRTPTEATTEAEPAADADADVAPEPVVGGDPSPTPADAGAGEASSEATESGDPPT